MNFSKRRKKRGRPVGSKTDFDTVFVKPPVCQRCGSSRRTKYTPTKKISVSGIFENFFYRRLTKRWCRCTECGRKRLEKHLDN